MDTIITPKLLCSEFRQCGGYNGSSFYNGELIELSVEETSFGNYLYMVQLLVAPLPLLKDENKEEFNKGKIEAILSSLDPLAETYIDVEKKTVSFSEAEFKKAVGENSELAKHSALMPYIIHYVALKKGFNFEDPSMLTQNFRPTEFEQNLVRCPKIKDEQMIRSVSEKTGVTCEEYLHPQPKFERRFRLFGDLT